MLFLSEKIVELVTAVYKRQVLPSQANVTRRRVNSHHPSMQFVLCN